MADHFQIPEAAKSRNEEMIYLRGQLSLSEEGEVLIPGDIAEQTRNAFRSVEAGLRRNGASLDDLVRLNTYYVYDGPEENATMFWEAMTRVRLEFLPDPGPAATAVRVAGDGADGLVIQFEAAALLPGSGVERQRLMPDECWDWSIPIPLSQGWRIGDRIFVGGQISCDMQGRATDIDNLDAQIANVWRFIDAVLREGGGSARDVCAMRICYRPESSTDGAVAAPQTIIRKLGAYLNCGEVAITAFGVNLLYEGLLLEIDVEAIPGSAPVTAIRPGTGLGSVTRAGSRIFCPARFSSAASEADQIKEIMGGIEHSICAAGGALGDIRKMNVYARKSAANAESAAKRQRVLDQIGKLLRDARPAITYVEVTSLPDPASVVQIDAMTD